MRRVGGEVSDETPVGWALRYAGLGWPVFPCDSHKKPLTKHGFKDATTDASQILEWWDQAPDAMIGMPTGETVGVTVVDVDTHRGGQLPADHQAAIEARTMSGGRHLYFAHEAGDRNTNDNVPGVDTRGEGGYVILPGSRGVKKDGSPGYYDWKKFPVNGGPVELTPMPADLRAALYGAKATAARAELPEDGAIPEGQRQSTLASEVGRMARVPGMTLPRLLHYARGVAVSCKPALSHQAADDCARRIFEREQSKPEAASSGFAPTGMAEFIEHAGEHDVAVEGFLIRGWLHLVTAYAGVGKTTMFGQIALQVARNQTVFGRFEVSQKRERILVISEAPREQWADLLKDMGGDAPEMLFSDFAPATMEELEQYVADSEVTGVLVDTLGTMSPLPNGFKWSEETGVRNLMMGYRLVARRTRAWVLLLHHTTKAAERLSDDESWEDLTAARGSAAIVETPDICWAMGKVKRPENRRKIKVSKPRWRDAADNVVLDFNHQTRLYEVVEVAEEELDTRPVKVSDEEALLALENCLKLSGHGDIGKLEALALVTSDAFRRDYLPGVQGEKKWKSWLERAALSAECDGVSRPLLIEKSGDGRRARWVIGVRDAEREVAGPAPRGAEPEEAREEQRPLGLEADPGPPAEPRDDGPVGDLQRGDLGDEADLWTEGVE